MNDAEGAKHRRANEHGEAGRVLLGHVSVDGAEMLIVDPAYLPQTKDALIESLRTESANSGWGGPVLKNPWRQGEHLAVHIRLESDGGYPVWAEQSTDGALLRVVIEIESHERVQETP